MSVAVMVQLRVKHNGERHLDALRRGSSLVERLPHVWAGETGMTPRNIIPILNKAGVRFVLMGTHGIGGWRSAPRATEDVDFLVRQKDHQKAVEAVRKSFPELKEVDIWL